MRLGILFVAFLLVGCGGGTDVTTELKLIKQAGRTLVAGRAAGDTSTENVTIESLKVPIRDISLGTGDSLSGGSGNANVLYECPESTEAGCKVEMIGTALQNLLTGGNVNSIEPATYTSVMVATCFSETTYTADIKARAEFKGATWYTKTGSSTMTTTAADYGPMTVTFTGCRNYSVLDTPIVIGETATTVNLYLDVRNLVTIVEKDGVDLFGQGGCTAATEPANDDPYLCMAYPNVVGNIGNTPTVERYRIEASGGGNAAKLIGLYFDADSDLPVGGYDRPYFNATYFDDSNLFGSFKRAYNEARGLVVTDYVSASTDVISGDGDNTMRSFPRLSIGQSQDNVAVTKGDGSANGSVRVTRLD